MTRVRRPVEALQIGPLRHQSTSSWLHDLTLRMVAQPVSQIAGTSTLFERRGCKHGQQVRPEPLQEAGGFVRRRLEPDVLAGVVRRPPMVNESKEKANVSTRKLPAAPGYGVTRRFVQLPQRVAPNSPRSHIAQPPSSAKSARISPTTLANLKPCPENPAAIATCG